MNNRVELECMPFPEEHEKTLYIYIVTAIDPPISLTFLKCPMARQA